MHKIIILVLVVTLGLLSCKNDAKEGDKLEIAKRYYEVLDQSKVSEMAALLTDTVLTKETEYNYEQKFSRQAYVTWTQWDSVFNPTYKILDIEQDSAVVTATVSKIDQRVLFLHEEPIVTKQVLHFKGDKISTIETTEYLVFKDSVFVANRTRLLSWMDENHPELNNFINDQTKAGGINYLKALALFKAAH